MKQVDSLNLKAIGILSHAIDEELGASNLVSREIMRAFTSGMLSDLNRAAKLFDSLPGWKRIKVRRRANYQARISLKKYKGNSARDWQLSNIEKLEELAPQSRNIPLPSFLLD